jgi:hypothetical protein
MERSPPARYPCGCQASCPFDPAAGTGAAPALGLTGCQDCAFRAARLDRPPQRHSECPRRHSVVAATTALARSGRGAGSTFFVKRGPTSRWSPALCVGPRQLLCRVLPQGHVCESAERPTRRLPCRPDESGRRPLCPGLSRSGSLRQRFPMTAARLHHLHLRAAAAFLSARHSGTGGCPPSSVARSPRAARSGKKAGRPVGLSKVRGHAPPAYSIATPPRGVVNDALGSSARRNTARLEMVSWSVRARCSTSQRAVQHPALSFE